MTQQHPDPAALAAELLQLEDALDGLPLESPTLSTLKVIADISRALTSAAALIEAQAALLARAREVLWLAVECHGRMLLTDPPQEAWKHEGVEAKARALATEIAALHASPQAGAEP